MESRLNFLNQHRPKGTLTITASDAQRINHIASKFDLDPETTFVQFFRACMSELIELQNKQDNQPAPVSPEPVKPAEEIPQEIFDIQFNADLKDLRCLKKRKALGESSTLSEMARQALTYLRTQPEGSHFIGSW